MNEVTENREHERPRFSRRILRHYNVLLVVILAGLIGITGGVTRGASLSLLNMQNVILQSCIRGIAAIGQAFVIISGGIDISIAGVGLVAATTGAVLTTSSAEIGIIGGNPLSLWAAIPIMLFIGLAFGTFNGTMVSRVGIPPLVVTLGMWSISQGVYYQISGQESIMGLPQQLAYFGGAIGGVPAPIIIFFSIAGVAYFVLNYTPYGPHLYAIGSNPVSASLSGINEPRMRQSAYMIASVLGSIAAIVLMSRVMSISYSTMRDVELDSIAACVVGGLSLAGGYGTIIGVVLGAIIIGVINNLLSIMQASTALMEMVTGIIILVAVAIDYIRRRDIGATMLRRRGGT